MLEAVEASQWYFFENWLLKLKFPHLLKPLGTIIQQNYWFFYPSEPFSYDHFNMIHPVWCRHVRTGRLWVIQTIPILLTVMGIFILVIDSANACWLLTLPRVNHEVQGLYMASALYTRLLLLHTQSYIIHHTTYYITSPQISTVLFKGQGNLPRLPV